MVSACFSMFQDVSGWLDDVLTFDATF